MRRLLAAAVAVLPPKRAGSGALVTRPLLPLAVVVLAALTALLVLAELARVLGPMEELVGAFLPPPPIDVLVEDLLVAPVLDRELGPMEDETALLLAPLLAGEFGPLELVPTLLLLDPTLLLALALALTEPELGDDLPALDEEDVEPRLAAESEPIPPDDLLLDEDEEEEEDELPFDELPELLRELGPIIDLLKRMRKSPPRLRARAGFVGSVAGSNSLRKREAVERQALTSRPGQR